MKINFSDDQASEDEGSSEALTDRVVMVPSSKGDQTYEVTIRSNGVAYKCTCKGYEFRGRCKHLDMVQEA